MSGERSLLLLALCSGPKRTCAEVEVQEVEVDELGTVSEGAAAVLAEGLFCDIVVRGAYARRLRWR